ncbi:ribulose-phosphate 3-epimerase isoform X3 [Psammomys obesus]|uniref:ribulose-phosphate 3-epimerase isoform X3 n=1 Tax=Psammomys obesus TaxID=48139 RepID=UPI002452BC1A|nr:ribulose-phosphate 3-epimerase isoform X3 [Psammomys obesus]
MGGGGARAARPIGTKSWLAPGSRGLTRSREPAPWRRAARSAHPSSTATWPTWGPSACACWTRGPTTCTWMHFVPNITFGHPVVESLRKQLGQDPFFDMHMMVSRPEQWVKPMAVAGANQYTFHLEATENPGALIKDIRENGMKVHWLRTQFPTLDIEVDGGVGPDTVQKCAEAGANMIVSGSAIMRSDDPRSVINLLRNVCSEAAQKRSLDR